MTIALGWPGNGLPRGNGVDVVSCNGDAKTRRQARRTWSRVCLIGPRHTALKTFLAIRRFKASAPPVRAGLRGRRERCPESPTQPRCFLVAGELRGRRERCPESPTQPRCFLVARDGQ